MMKTCLLTQIKDEMIGKIGTPKRDEYEFNLKLALSAKKYLTGKVNSKN